MMKLFQNNLFSKCQNIHFHIHLKQIRNYLLNLLIFQLEKLSSSVDLQTVNFLLLYVLTLLYA